MVTFLYLLKVVLRKTIYTDNCGTPNPNKDAWRGAFMCCSIVHGIGIALFYGILDLYDKGKLTQVGLMFAGFAVPTILIFSAQYIKFYVKHLRLKQKELRREEHRVLTTPIPRTVADLIKDEDEYEMQMQMWERG